MPTTAVKRRYGNPINALRHGAVGDGIADDTAAIQAAFTSAAVDARPVYIPAPSFRYRTTDTVIVPDGVPLVYGDGALSLIRAEAPDGLVLTLDGCSDITVKDIGLTCSLAGRDARSQGIRVDSCSRVHVDRVTAIGGVSVGVMVVASDDVAISGCVVKDAYADGIHVVGASSNVTVTGCRVVNPGDDGIAFVNYGTGVGQPENPTQFRCQAIGNTIVNSSAGGIGVHGASECIVASNSIDVTATHGISVDGEGAYDLRTPARVIITGNTIVDAGSTAESGSYHGIVVSAMANTDPETDTIINGNIVSNPQAIGIYSTAEKTTIIGNQVDMGAVASPGIQCGTTTAGTTPPDDTIITGNRVYGLGAAGIIVTCPSGSTADRVSITGNMIVEPIGGLADGILVARGSGVTVSGNTIIDHGGARSAILLSDCATADVSGNTTVGNTTIALSSCTDIRIDEMVVSATPSDTTTYRPGQVAVDTTNNRFAIFNGSSWSVVS